MPSRDYKSSLIAPARSAAFEILRRVEETSSFASTLLANSLDPLSPVDRALCYELVLGTLRWQLWLDRLAGCYSRRKPEGLDPPVRRALRMGLYQIRFLSGVPASAAVNESVALAHRFRLSSAAPFINAVLRRAVREPDCDPVKNISDPLERLSVTVSHPAWLIERWAASFGLVDAEELALSNNQPPIVCFRVSGSAANNPLKTLGAAGYNLEESKLVPGAWKIVNNPANSALKEMSEQGLIYIQDEASQLIAHVVGVKPGELILDACAAPGSKTTLMANLASNRAVIAAGDLHLRRLEVLRQSAQRQSLDAIFPVALDAASLLPFRHRSFDRVLVDAPCTGTGTLRRNPEIRWRITPDAIKKIQNYQLSILLNAASAVKPGGRLVYSTCSVEAEENEEVIEAFLAASAGNFKPASLGIPGRFQGTNVLRTWQHISGGDAFFVAAFLRER